MIGYGVEIVNLPRINAQFTRIDKGLESLKPMWKDFQSQFHAEETNHFANAPWEPLSRRYAERKLAEHGPKPLLQVTEDLMRSFTESKVKGAIRRIEDLSAEFGSDIPYARFHQLGTDIMPARPPLVEPDERVYGTLAGRYLENVVQRSN